MPVYITHPLIQPETVEARDYQLNLSVAAARDSVLVVLPTGMGKTVVALLVLADALKRHPDGKVLLLAPTKPLVEQHVAFLERTLALEQLGPDPALVVQAFSGSVAPAERKGQWDAARIVVATPQVVENDLISRRYDLSPVCLTIYDEAHRGVGEYSYVYVAERYRTHNPKGRALGITASPGSRAEDILALCANLDLNRAEIRDEGDPDVAPYVHSIRVEWRRIELPEHEKKVIRLLKAASADRVRTLRKLRFLPGSGEPTRRDLLALAGEIQARLREAGANPPRELFDGLSLQAQCVKLSHAIELAETQGASSFLHYAGKLQKEEASGASKASRSIVADANFNQAVLVAKHHDEVHPKVTAVLDEVRKELSAHPGSRIIVFTHFRDTSETVLAHLEKLGGCRPGRFIGQSSRSGSKGITQKAQKDMVEAFRRGEVNVLVGTSVAEEGLDIPETDLVVFYEPIPSEIRTIQRRGRTGRKRDGRAVVLMAVGTRDEGYHWAARRREETMRKELRLMRHQVSQRLGPRRGQVPLPTTVRREATGEAPTQRADEGLLGSWLEKRSAARRDAQSVLLAEMDDPTRSPTSPTRAPTDETPSPSEPTRAPADMAALPAATDGSRAETGMVAPERGEGPEAALQPPSAPYILPPVAAASADASFQPAKPREPSELAERFRGEDVTLLVDHREFRSSVVRQLSRMPLRVEAEQLAVADYLCSTRVAVERKEVADFLDSLLGGRLFKQARELAAFRAPILIIEGEGLTESRNIPRSSIYGALASLTADYGITVLTTRSAEETADLLYSIAKREQTEARREAPIRPEKGAMSDEEQVRFILEGLPGISAVLARRLVAHFGSAAKVLKAKAEQLERVDGIGPKTAAEIRRVLELDVRRKD